MESIGLAVNIEISYVSASSKEELHSTLKCCAFYKIELLNSMLWWFDKRKWKLHDNALKTFTSQPNYIILYQSIFEFFYENNIILSKRHSHHFVWALKLILHNLWSFPPSKWFNLRLPLTVLIIIYATKKYGKYLILFSIL